MSSPASGSPEELDQFARLQAKLPTQFRAVFPDRRAPRTVVVVPSLSLDPEVLATIPGIQHYEERMLCMLMLLRLPSTKVVYVTSMPIDPTVVDYHLHLLAGVPGSHARQRVRLLSAHDSSPATVAKKILDRPRLLNRIRSEIADPDAAHLTVFNATAVERSLAVRLGIPLYGCDPALLDLGSKSGSRETFQAAGVPVPDGFERLRDMTDVAEALAELKRQHPDVSRAVLKLEHGTSGGGNALFDYGDTSSRGNLRRWIDAELPARLSYEGRGENWDVFSTQFEEMGGVVERWVEGEAKRSPSVQCRIDPLGAIEVISTHDQVLGGPSGQIFLASTFPADSDYRLEVQTAGERIAGVLRERGVLGRFGVDFVSTRQAGRWAHWAVETNLRKGGTTHPFMTLQFLTDGHYEHDTGVFRTPTGEARCYYASDNLENPIYRRLIPDDLIDIAVEHELHFHGATQAGVVFQMIGALSEFGKLGVVCVSDSVDNARQLYQRTVDVLDEEALAAS